MGKHCGVFRSGGCNARATFVPTRPSVCLQSFVTKLGIVVHHKPECHAKKKWDSISKVKVWVYIIKIGVFTISFISSKPASLLQPNSVRV